MKYLLYIICIYFLIIYSTIYSENIKIPLSKFYKATPFIAANELFKSSSVWLGGDGATSLDLGNNRVLWLFGDSFIATSMNKTRFDSIIIRNSIAIQYGYNPAEALIEFHWNQYNNIPKAFFKNSDHYWYWPASGIKLKDLVVIFLMKIKRTTKGFGFISDGWKAVCITNPDVDPLQWNIKPLYSPQNASGILIGSGSIVKHKSHIYAFCSGERDNHAIYLVRWKLKDFANGYLSDMQWWYGYKGWIYHWKAVMKPIPVFKRGQTEFSVHPELPAYEYTTYISFQTEGIHSPYIFKRFGDSVIGKWGNFEPIYKVQLKKNQFIYGAKAHPELAGGDIIVTYNKNSFDFFDLFEDDTIYYPQFLKVSKNQIH